MPKKVSQTANPSAIVKTEKVKSTAKPKKEKKVESKPEIFDDVDIMDEINKYQVSKNKNSYDDLEYMDEEEKPQVSVRVSVRYALPEESDKIVKDIFDKLKVFNNTNIYEAKFFVGVSV